MTDINFDPRSVFITFSTFSTFNKIHMFETFFIRRSKREQQYSKLKPGSSTEVCIPMRGGEHIWKPKCGILKKYEKLHVRFFRYSDNLCLFLKLCFFAAFDGQRCVAFSPSYDLAPPPKLRLIFDPTGYRAGR